MTTTLELADHEAFHRAAVVMVTVGAAGGLMAHVVTAGGLPVGVAGGAMAAAAAVAAVAMPLNRTGRAGRLARGLGMVAAGGLGAWLARRMGSTPGAIAAMSLAVALVLSQGLGGARRLAALGVGALLATAAWLVATRIQGAAQLATTPGALVAMLAGAGFGAIATVGLLGRHVSIVRDPVAMAVATLPPRLDGEVRGLVARGESLWASAGRTLPASDPSRQLIADGVIRLVEVARRWAAVDARQGDASLEARIVELDGRIAATRDDVTREQYAEARAALVAQRRYIDNIAQSRERLVARMHNYVAAIEKLRLAAVNLEGASANQLAVEARPMVAMIEELGADMDGASAAMGELTAGSADDASA